MLGHKNTSFLPSNVNLSELKPSDIPSEQVLRQMGLSEDEVKQTLILNKVKRCTPIILLILILI